MAETSLSTPPTSPVPEAAPVAETVQSPVPPTPSSTSPPPDIFTSVTKSPDQPAVEVTKPLEEPVRVEIEVDDGSDDLDGVDDRTPLNP